MKDRSSDKLGGVAALLALPLRELWRRTSVVFFGAFSIALLLLGQAESIIIEQSRRVVTDIATPFLALVSEPVTGMRDLIDAIDAHFVVYEENRNLKAEVERLKRWEMTARALESERDALAALTKQTNGAAISELTARVVADTSSPFVRSVMIDAGQVDNILKGQAVMDSTGLVGRVDGVGAHASRLLLVTDLNSRVPVRLERDRSPAIVAGTNRNALELMHLPKGVSVVVGDYVVTSGDGGLFPAGIRVGRVAVVSDQGVLVSPSADLLRLDRVQVLRHRINLDVPSYKDSALAPQADMLIDQPIVFLDGSGVEASRITAVLDGARPHKRGEAGPSTTTEADEPSPAESGGE